MIYYLLSNLVEEHLRMLLCKYYTSYLARHDYIVLQNSSNRFQYTWYIYSLSYVQFTIRDISYYFEARLIIPEKNHNQNDAMIKIYTRLKNL